MFFIIGLGNPGNEYENTRHNTGRIVLGALLKDYDFPELKLNNKVEALVSEGKVGKEKVMVLEPETFMNKSGSVALKVVKSAKMASKLFVVHDDLDLPFGKIKVSFNRSSGGHRGVESIMRALKTEAFGRIRIGIAPTTPSGKLKKPDGEKKVCDFILGKFKPAEELVLKKISKTVSEAIATTIEEGLDVAMNRFNS